MNKFKFNFVALIMSVFFAVSCNQNDNIGNQKLSLSSFDIYGDIHNKFMDNVHTNFVPNKDLKTFEQALDYIDNFQQSFLESLNLNGIDNKELSLALTNSVSLVV